MESALQKMAELVRLTRRQRGWTLAQLAEATGCSKAYLSGLENCRLVNPPRRRLLESMERALGMSEGQLTRLAEWLTTPAGVQDDYRRLAEGLRRMAGRRGDGAVNLDELYRSGALHRCVGGGGAADDAGTAGSGDEAQGSRGKPLETMENIMRQAMNPATVPLINKVAAGAAAEFTDHDYPAQVADEYVPCMGAQDPEAFAARVVGESMMPEYREGDVIVFSPARAVVDGSDCYVRLLPDHQSTFKRVYFEAEGRVRLQPLNAAFAARVVMREEIDGLYAAVMRMTAIGPR